MARNIGLSPALAKISNQLQVDGHTNQQNVSTAPYPSGWELSSARASSVSCGRAPWDSSFRPRSSAP